MVHEDVAQDRQLTVNGGNFAERRLERCAEALQGGGVVEFSDFELDLVADELAFEIWDEQRVS